MLYYSNNILSKALPDVGPYVSLGITIVNFFMTAAPIFLIDVRAHFPLVRCNQLFFSPQRLGRKKLLSLSATGAIVSLVAVGFGLDSGAVALASTAIITFVACVLHQPMLGTQDKLTDAYTGPSLSVSALYHS